jgi:FlaA1/EpsC-like NDP-sugar epimerase
MVSFYISARNQIIRYRFAAVIFFQIVQIVLANYLAFLIRFGGVLTPVRIGQIIQYAWLLVLVQLAAFVWSGLHRDLWRYSSIGNLVRIIVSTTVGTVAFGAIVYFVLGDAGYPRSIYIIYWMLMVFFTGGTRLFVRVFREYGLRERSERRVLIIGAGDAGEMIVREMKNNPFYKYRPMGFIDDDVYKRGLTIHDVKILGPMSELQGIMEHMPVDEILIAIPSAGSRVIRQVYDACAPYKIPVNILPALSDIVSGKVSVSQIKPLSMEDLLQREPVRTDIESVSAFITGQVVLITGAGGSIGSELARQIAQYGPDKLVMLDRYENGLYTVGMETVDVMGERAVAVVRDITDRKGLARVFAEHRPTVVFHAAAHKHVPLMEHNPLEAIKNNVFGTRNVLETAREHGVGHFVMISTDKAVNPTNVMGATKRIAEFLTLKANGADGMRTTTVRFGNVLGSNGSVLEVFRRQVEKGGPITVTHPEITRYFMLIPEAVQLVLVAASRGKGGEIIVLEMGEPVRIVDFAEQFIRLSGFEPYAEVDIKFIGLRPGEKLYEELFDRSERCVETGYRGLRMAIPEPPSDQVLSEALDAFRAAVDAERVEGLDDLIRAVVPGYKPASEAGNA